MSPLSQELFLGESPFVQEHGEIQIGVGATHLEFKRDASESDITFEFEYGITEALTAGVEIPFVTFETGPPDLVDESGLGDAELSLLYGIINNEEFVLTAGVEFNLRTGDEDKDLGEEEFEWEPSISLATEAGTGQFMATLGAEISDDETGINYTAAYSFPMGKMVGIIEAYGTIADDEDEEDLSYIAFGVLWEIGDETEFQVAVPVGLNDDSADWGIVAKWNIEFE